MFRHPINAEQYSECSTSKILVAIADVKDMDCLIIK